MLGWLFSMRAQIDNATATPTNTGGELSTRDLRRPIAGVGFSRHACREKSPANPTASTKPPKHLGTLRRACLPDRQAPSARTNVTSRCNIAPHTPRAHRAGRPKVSVFLVDTPVEIENGFSPSESTTSPNLSRYTFGMFGNAEKGGFYRAYLMDTGDTVRERYGGA
jgi:hypothetical protein